MGQDGDGSRRAACMAQTLDPRPRWCSTQAKVEAARHGAPGPDAWEATTLEEGRHRTSGPTVQATNSGSTRPNTHQI